MNTSVLISILFVAIFCVGLSNSEAIAKNADNSNPEQKQRVKRQTDTVTSIFGSDNESQEQSVNAPAPAKKTKTAAGFLPLPPGYNKLVIPLANVSKSIFIMLHMSIREVLDVDTNTGIIALDTELGITWIDWEIWKYFIEDKEAQERARQGEEEIILDAEFLKQIWKPDIFIEEMAGVEKTFLLSKLITLRFLVKNPLMPGAITFRSRQTFKVRCDMDFTYFPADTQKCGFNIRSYSYPQDKLFLVWDPSQKIYLDNIIDSNYDMQVSNVEPGEELYDLFTTFQAPCCSHQNFSTLTFTLQLRRNLKYHLIQTALPSVLLILITWLCFLIPPDLVEARIGVSMTTLLTITAMFTSVREQSPQVSYTKAIDIWMVFCILILFLALVLFTIIYWMRRRLDRITGSKTDEHTIPELPNGMTAEDDITASKMYISVLKHSKKFAFVGFAIIFIAFLVMYGTWLSLSSGYVDWEPSPQYNAIPIENVDGSANDTNRIFTMQEKKFRANSTKKIIESQYRFKDIFKQVIYPKIQEIAEKEAEEEYEEEEEAAASVEATTPESLDLKSSSAEVNSTTKPQIT